MTTLITNEERTMLDALANALQTSDSVDICVGYFYFSGFQLLAEQLKNKRIRILVGMEIDPECIQEIVKNSRENDVSLERYAPRRPTKITNAAAASATNKLLRRYVPKAYWLKRVR